MAREIERKFLVGSDAWRSEVETSRHIVQAYVALDTNTSVRVRISDGRKARLTVKFGLSHMVREEFEYEIPVEDARQMVSASRGRLVEKTRYHVRHEGFVWEVDEYAGALAGLVIAEVEMQSEDDAPALPAWLGREVTGDGAWSNARLAVNGLPEEAPV
ncbi:CYTH domain-containing protein [Oricola indica]|uniref:CYTH domain-containing protein n=1 Tax=Oricola indica TaxID=2872591 RepID=UPI003CCC05AE